MTTLTTMPDHLAAIPAVGPARSDEELAAEARAGSLSAFGELVDRYEGRLIGFARGRLGSMEDARECVQEAFLRAWERRATYRIGERFGPWIFTITARISSDAWRRRKRWGGSVAESTGPHHADTADWSPRDHSEARGAEAWSVAEALFAPEIVEALWLRYVAELEAEEIALVLGRTAVGVRVMLLRARRKLAAELSRRGQGLDSARGEWPADVSGARINIEGGHHGQA